MKLNLFTEHARELLKMCAHCVGSGRRVKRWSSDGGTEYMVCNKCGGEGKKI